MPKKKKKKKNTKNSYAQYKEGTKQKLKALDDIYKLEDEYKK